MDFASHSLMVVRAARVRDPEDLVESVEELVLAIEAEAVIPFTSTDTAQPTDFSPLPGQVVARNGCRCSRFRTGRKGKSNLPGLRRVNIKQPMTIGTQFGIGLACLAAVIGAGLVFVHPDADLEPAASELPQVIAEAKRRGFPMTAGDVVPPRARPSDSENAASDLETLTALNQTDPDLQQKLGDVRRAILLEPETAPKLIAGFALQFESIEAICSKTDLWIERNWDLGPTLETEDLGTLRTASRLLAFRAEVRSITGDKAGTIADLERLNRLIGLASKEPILNSVLNRVLMDAQRLTSMRRIANRWTADVEGLQKLRALADVPVGVPDMRTLVRTKSYGALALLRNFRAFGGPNAFLDDGNPRGHLIEPASPSKLVKSGLPEAKYEQANLAWAYKYWLEIADTVDKPGFTALELRDTVARASARVRQVDGRASSVIRELMPTDMTYMQLYSGETQRQLTLAYLDAFLARARTGRFPDKPERPYADPYGHFLGYRATKDTLTIWSVGSDLVDNGGKRIGASNRFFDDVVEFPVPPMSQVKPQQGAGSRV